MSSPLRLCLTSTIVLILCDQSHQIHPFFHLPGLDSGKLGTRSELHGFELLLEDANSEVTASQPGGEKPRFEEREDFPRIIKRSDSSFLELEENTNRTEREPSHHQLGPPSSPWEAFAHLTGQGFNQANIHQHQPSPPMLAIPSQPQPPQIPSPLQPEFPFYREPVREAVNPSPPIQPIKFVPQPPLPLPQPPISYYYYYPVNPYTQQNRIQNHPHYQSEPTAWSDPSPYVWPYQAYTAPGQASYHAYWSPVQMISVPRRKVARTQRPKYIHVPVNLIPIPIKGEPSRDEPTVSTWPEEKAHEDGEVKSRAKGAREGFHQMEEMDLIASEQNPQVTWLVLVDSGKNGPQAVLPLGQVSATTKIVGITR